MYLILYNQYIISLSWYVCVVLRIMDDSRLYYRTHNFHSKNRPTLSKNRYLCSIYRISFVYKRRTH